MKRDSAETPLPAQFDGSLDRIVSGFVQGWAVKRGDDSAVRVDVLVDGVPAATGWTRFPGEDVERAGHRGAQAGYRIVLPETLCDGAEHDIAVVVGQTGQELKGSPKRAVLRPWPSLKLFAVVMMRNERDIVFASLSRMLTLFDGVIVADHGSTDGTTDIVAAMSEADPRLVLLKFRYKGHFQSEVITALTQFAFSKGATWVFPTDMDEFIDVENRLDLLELMNDFPSDVMFLRWANLIPKKMGTFSHFDLTQNFLLDGVPSHFGKIAVKSSYALRNPDFIIGQGNHAISPYLGSLPSDMQDGVRLFHIPVRSIDRLLYKVGSGARSYEAKPGRTATEGIHWFQIEERLRGDSPDPDWLNGLILNYGKPLESIRPVPACDVPRSTFIGGLETTTDRKRAGKALAETLEADQRQVWEPAKFAPGSVLQADINNGLVILRPRLANANTRGKPKRFGVRALLRIVGLGSTRPGSSAKQSK